MSERNVAGLLQPMVNERISAARRAGFLPNDIKFDLNWSSATRTLTLQLRSANMGVSETTIVMAEEAENLDLQHVPARVVKACEEFKDKAKS